MRAKREELTRRVEELESSLAELKRGIEELEEKDQHEAIDHLDEYLEDIDHKYENVKRFLPVLVDDLRALLHLKKK